MKKLTFLLTTVALLVISAPACADGDRSITVAELPATSQQLLKSHFAEAKVSYATMDKELFDQDYTVIFTDGAKIKFAKDGAWKEIRTKFGEVPAALIPSQVATLVAQQFPGRKIVEIEREQRHCEVRLDNGFELKFDKNYKLVKLDD